MADGIPEPFRYEGKGRGIGRDGTTELVLGLVGAVPLRAAVSVFGLAAMARFSFPMARSGSLDLSRIVSL
ncbi:hypothetical protein [Streptomyces mirabilis]|uniref:hypothetical protein n=1 Tax=Streptomyces mirabilis TaxID=68239 RepID=UPI00365BED99